MQWCIQIEPGISINTVYATAFLSSRQKTVMPKHWRKGNIKINRDSKLKRKRNRISIAKHWKYNQIERKRKRRFHCQNLIMQTKNEENRIWKKRNVTLKRRRYSEGYEEWQRKSSWWRRSVVTVTSDDELSLACFFFSSFP